MNKVGSKIFMKSKKKKKQDLNIYDLLPFSDLRICGNDQSFFALNQCSPLVTNQNSEFKIPLDLTFLDLAGLKLGT